MQAEPIFAATLTPHNALSATGLRNVMIVFAGLAALPSLIFFQLGAWPILGFMGLDILLVWWALSASRRAGRRFEEVTLWSDALEIRQVSAAGAENHERFNPFYVRLVIERDYDERTTALRLRTRERELEIGAFLNPEDKASFAKVFGSALRKARG
ncbi:DUF2244 domain-containing protein [Arsenicitalea aurantiaca]|uniref:DUF2244 domain-containing protein n=1 Tax=Arsenicitalea aurantiaca TaxID=1783274 RepID=A0A433X7W6_9HYPH|nr:DUF2244 domain-containing protein [Arsenicitalea aurantiaca]RUT30166.1 DUF2244 domain-containing protein [Arsenicitalea aurantiaca]